MNVNRKSSTFAYPDLASGGVLMAVGAFCFFQAIKLPFGSVVAPDSGFFPISLSVLLFVCGLIIAGRSFAMDTFELGFSRGSSAVLFAALAFVLYAIFVNAIGYLVATALVLLLVSKGLGGLNWKSSAILTIPAVVISYLAFVELGVPLPRGIMPF
jgi:hypothetical protein